MRATPAQIGLSLRYHHKLAGMHHGGAALNLLETIGIWCLFVCAVFACRLYCQGSMEARLGVWGAHLLSVVLSSSAIFLLGALFIADYSVEGNAPLLWIGGLWLGLSVAFELLLRRFILGMEWSGVFFDYNLRRGRFYSLLLLTVFFTPAASYHLFFA